MRAHVHLCTTHRHWYCFTEWREWFTIWFNWHEFIVPFINCWYEQMSLQLDPRSGRSFNKPGTPHLPCSLGVC
jgi:hypothetical protein